MRHVAVDFRYAPEPGKKPAFVQVSLHFEAAGSVWFDDVRLFDPLGVNLLADSTISSTRFPPAPFEHRFTSKNLDDFVAFARDVGAEPIWQWGSLAALDMPKSLAGDPDGLERAVLAHPSLDALLLRELDVLRYANVEKRYGIKYWELLNEPEIWWTWLDGGFNAGWREDLVFKRYRLYGRLYARIAPRAKTIDPNIRIGVAVMWGKHYKASIDGFLQGIADHTATTGDPAERPVPMPQFFAPHPYQLASWGRSPGCPNEDDARGPKERTCVDNMLRYAVGEDAARCDASTLDVVGRGDVDPNPETRSFVDATLECMGKLLERKNLPPALIPTEWGVSGATEIGDGRFATEVWAADRLGRFAELGVFGPVHWNLGGNTGILAGAHGKIGSPYTVFGLMARLLDRPARVLATSTSAPDRVTVHAFREHASAPIHLVIANLDPREGATPVRLRLPIAVAGRQAEIREVSCAGESCAYARNATRLDGELVTTQNVASLLARSGRVIPSGALLSAPFTMKNHSVWIVTLR
jgi:hypothetical protein